ncbi:MAG: hypothetical protein ABI969_17720 [bacterium]
MIKPKLLRHIAVYGVSLPTFAVSPAVAKATVYMPSQVAARMLGGKAARSVGLMVDVDRNANGQSSSDASHAA